MLMYLEFGISAAAGNKVFALILIISLQQL